MLSKKQNDDAIVITGLTKRFGNTAALDRLTMSVKTGHVHGFLGPNGSGKSTTIRILLGLLRKTSGDVRLLGGDPWHDAVALHRRLAYVPGEVNLWPNLSGGEVIDLLTSLRGKLDRNRRDDLIRRFELDPTKKCRAYSKGNRQKVALIAALASDVELYIFDEPTSGLDPLMEAVFQDCVKDAKRDGKTILLSSHILAEVEALCDHLTIIRKGKAIQSGTLKQLQGIRRMHVSAITVNQVHDLEKVPGVHNLRTIKHEVQFEIEPDKLEYALKYLLSFGVKNLTSTPPTLETLFKQEYAGDEA